MYFEEQRCISKLTSITVSVIHIHHPLAKNGAKIKYFPSPPILEYVLDLNLTVMIDILSMENKKNLVGEQRWTNDISCNVVESRKVSLPSRQLQQRSNIIQCRPILALPCNVLTTTA